MSDERAPNFQQRLRPEHTAETPSFNIAQYIDEYGFRAVESTLFRAYSHVVGNLPETDDTEKLDQVIIALTDSMPKLQNSVIVALALRPETKVFAREAKERGELDAELMEQLQRQFIVSIGFAKKLGSTNELM